ncbi:MULTISPECIES: RraA family protein [unclassified Methylobacterium]|jgi:regulator of RNase E activity RraA|uniref:RraA family protein n=1 Tax=unclassified Methylobacterium TaxID=2615210 RepID=UPI002484B033|nr:hypothetical protein [Methylobacterium sp. 2A]
MPLGSSTGAYKSGPVRLNVPVCVGAVVNPGDVLVGDENGLVAFPQEQVPMLTERAQAKLRLEQAIMVGIDGGAGRQDWLHDTLWTLRLEKCPPLSSP